MSLASVSIKRPVFAWMMMVALMLFGIISFRQMGVGQLPDVDFPVITVGLGLDGAAPEVMEADLVDPIEDAVMGIQGVKSVSSSSRAGSANVTVEFELGRDIDLAMQDVQARVAQAQRRLPKDIDAPVISKTNPEDNPIMWMALTSPSIPMKDLMRYVRDELKDEFSTVPGVGEVFLGGYVEPNLRVWVDEKKLASYQFTLGDVINTIRDEHAEPPAGKLTSGAKEYNLRTLGEALSVRDFENLPIMSRGGQPNYAKIKIKDVANVEEGLADIRRLSRGNGLPSVGIGIRKQRGANAVAVARAVRAKVDLVKPRLMKGTELGINFDSTIHIEHASGELNFTVLLSAILTGIVCWFFLGSWSSTLNVLLAIPTSVLGTFTFIYFLGFTLNTFTLLALSLAIGVVVDDSIMVLENIFRHKSMGKPKEKAALDGANEITFAATAATIAIIAIFLPVAFMKGPIGAFFLQFGVTITIAVALSLLEALTLTPMRCSQMLGSDSEHGTRTTAIGHAVDRAFEWSRDVYARSLSFVLLHRKKALLFSVVFFVGSMMIVKKINKEFVPFEDQSRFLVRMQTAVGSSMAHTDEKMKLVEAKLKTYPEVVRFFGAVGGFGGGEVNTAMLFITLKDKKERKIGQADIMQKVRKDLTGIPGLKVSVQDLSMRGFSGGGRGFPLEFVIQGPEFEELGRLAKSWIAELEKTGLVTDMDSDYLVGMPEIHVVPDREKASLHGVSVGDIGLVIQAGVSGLVTGKYSKGGHRYDIRLKLKEDPALDPKRRLSSLSVRNNRGELIPLSQVVKIEEKPMLQLISRKNRMRSVTVFGNIKQGASLEKVQQEALKISEKILANGGPEMVQSYRVRPTGSSESFKESFDSLKFAFILGLIVAYMVLASQFNRYSHPFTVLLALPFSLSGAFLALYAFNQSINIYSMIGILLLMGIAKKNSILLVDYTNQLREEQGLPIEDALKKACPVRLRPIMMTSIATIVGAIPPALAIGPGAESRVPMALVVIGGMIVSTLFTLFVVPCAYRVMNR